MNIQRIFRELIQQQTDNTPMSWVSTSAYRERFTDWRQHAGVRRWSPAPSHPGGGVLPFSLALVPLAEHRLVCNRGEETRDNVLAQHFYRFCNFTEHLELEAVVPACVHLRFADTPFAVPAALARDAGRVIIDEAWHAECAGDLTARMRKVLAFVPCRQRKPAFMHVLRIVKASMSVAQQVLADLVFACVSETLITGSLTKVPRDLQVLPEIREVLAEHAREEAFHHSIFGQAIGVMWSQLTAADRDASGPLFGVFIAAFLRPDVLSELDALEAAGFAAAEAKQIVEETHDEGILSQDLCRAATPTVRFMRQHGLLDHAATQETLEMMGLVEPTNAPRIH